MNIAIAGLLGGISGLVLVAVVMKLEDKGITTVGELMKWVKNKKR